MRTTVRLLSSCVSDITDSKADTTTYIVAIAVYLTYVCKRPCFVTLEQISKLESEVEELKQGLKERLNEPS